MLLTELVYCVNVTFTRTKWTDQLHHDNVPALVQAFLVKCAPGLSAPLQPRFGSLWFLALPEAKISIEMGDICECNGHSSQLNQWCLTADWLAPQESDCSWVHSKVFSDWLPSYIKATRPVLEIFKMAGLSGQPSYVSLKRLWHWGVVQQILQCALCATVGTRMTRLVVVLRTGIGKWNNVCMVVLASVFSLDTSNVMKSYTEVVWLWTHLRQEF